MVGQTLGHYRILEKIGAGGMGEVYRAHDDRLDRDVALKLLPAENFTDTVARTRLVREARTASKLNHPHICTIHEVGESEGQTYIAMELVEGKSLSERLARGALPFRDALNYGLQLADALAHAHERGVVHRDVKSANVIVTPDGRVKVLDFGLAKRVTSEEEMHQATTQASVTSLGAIAGTLAYMAPEQLRGQQADARSDMWALGVVLYEMCAGARPFRGQTGFELSSAVLSEPPPPLPPGVPFELRRVIDRCLEKDPGLRFQNGSELCAALALAQATPDLKGPAYGHVTWRHALTSQRRVALAAAAVAFVVLGLSALGWPPFAGVRDRLSGGPRIETLAVLPLVNLSGDAGQEFLADGMTDALITDLARLGTFKRVIAPGSVMRYKGTDKTLQAIAQELGGVDALLTGAVTRVGSRVRVTAQLIDADTEDQIWTDRYERDLQDILTLQNEILRSIAAGIQLKLTPQDAERLTAAATVNPEAYEAVLKGKFHITQLTADNQQTAIAYFESALKKDPDYAPAYAGIARAWSSRGHMGILPSRDAALQARPYASRALQLDERLAEAHLSAAVLSLYHDWDWAAADKHLRRSIALSPGHPEAHLWYSDLLNVSGRPREALVEIERGLELDPLNFFIQTSAAGRLLRLGRSDAALELLRKAVKTEPSLVLAHRYFWPLYHQREMYNEAATSARAFFTASGYPDVAAAIERGHREGAYQRAMSMGADTLASLAKTRYVQPTQIATLYAHAGQKDRAFDWLDRAYEIGDSWLVFVKDDPRFESLRSDPRFTGLVEKMKFPG